MKLLAPSIKILRSRKKIMILMLCFLLGKLSLAGYFLVKSGRLSYEPFLKEAVAQEKEVETAGVEDALPAAMTFGTMNRINIKMEINVFMGFTSNKILSVIATIQ